MPYHPDVKIAESFYKDANKKLFSMGLYEESTTEDEKAGFHNTALFHRACSQ